MSVSTNQVPSPAGRAPDDSGALGASQLGPPAFGAWTARQRWGAAIQAVVALLLIGVAVQSSIRGLDDHNPRVHHLEHAVLVVGGGLLGLLAARWAWPPGRRFSWEKSPWLRPAALGLLVGEPLVLMAIMIPSTSPWIETHPPVHALEHLVLIGLGAVLGLVGRLFSPALGWLLVVLTAGMMAVFGGMILAHPVSAAIGHGMPVFTLVLNFRG